MPRLFPINKSPTMSTFPAAHSSLAPGPPPLLCVGRTCLHRIFCNAFMEIPITGEDQSLSLCRAGNRAVPETRDPGVRHSRPRGQQNSRTGLKVCKGKRAGDRDVRRGWGGKLRIMSRTTFAWLATFLALLFKEYFSEERRNSRKLPLQPCMEM